MKRGDFVWVFVPRKGVSYEKRLMVGELILKKDGLWHIKTKRGFCKRETNHIAKRCPEDKELLKNY